MFLSHVNVSLPLSPALPRSLKSISVSSMRIKKCDPSRDLKYACTLDLLSLTAKNSSATMGVSLG